MICFMKLSNIKVRETLDRAMLLLEEEKNISPALKVVIETLFIMMQVMIERLALNSKNSSKPPASDPNREKKNKPKSKRKPGGQQGHIGAQLKPVDNPDHIEDILIDRRTLPRGQYQPQGFDARQVIDFSITAFVVEYRAEILIDNQGNQFVAHFPGFVTRPIQYGPKTKAHSVYMSQHQLIPYQRIAEYFSDNANMSISAGSFFNFNKEAYDGLDEFEMIAKQNLIAADLLNVDETGININGTRWWLHTTCNDKWTHFYPHVKRGSEATKEIGILPKYQGILCHDHWKAYYKYNCDHALCNAHHIRELEWSSTEDHQQWATEMKNLLMKINDKVKEAGGKLSASQSQYYRKRYRTILASGDKKCPDPNAKRPKGKPGRMKKSKSRNLLERLVNYEADVLRFMDNPVVPFTNNQGENDLRMTKVQQKISGCFRSTEGAYLFCRIRAYLITCRKHDVNATDALELLFQGELPAFVDSS